MKLDIRARRTDLSSIEAAILIRHVFDRLPVDVRPHVPRFVAQTMALMWEHETPSAEQQAAFKQLDPSLSLRIMEFGKFCGAVCGTVADSMGHPPDVAAATRRASDPAPIKPVPRPPRLCITDRECTAVLCGPYLALYATRSAAEADAIWAQIDQGVLPDEELGKLLHGLLSGLAVLARDGGQTAARAVAWITEHAATIQQRAQPVLQALTFPTEP